MCAARHGVYLGELEYMATGVVAVDGVDELVHGGLDGGAGRRRRQGGVGPGGGVAHVGRRMVDDPSHC